MAATRTARVAATLLPARLSAHLDFDHLRLGVAHLRKRTLSVISAYPPLAAFRPAYAVRLFLLTAFIDK